MHLNNGLTSYPFIYRRKLVTLKVLYFVIAPFIAIALAQFIFWIYINKYKNFIKAYADDGLLISLYSKGGGNDKINPL